MCLSSAKRPQEKSLNGGTARVFWPGYPSAPMISAAAPRKRSPFRQIYNKP